MIGKKIDPEFISHMAWLARLSLGPQEREKFARDFEQILEFISKVEQLPLNVMGSFHLQERENIEAREDQAQECLPEIQEMIKEQFLRIDEKGYLVIKSIFKR